MPLDTLAPVTDDGDYLGDDADLLTHLDAEPRTARSTLHTCAPSARRAKYQEVVLYAYAHIGHAPARLLCAMANKARADLSNYFLRRQTLMRELGLTSMATLVTQLRRLEEDGWIVRHAHFKETGQRSSSGVQFCLPKGVLPEGAWRGPVDFSNRRSVRTEAGRDVEMASVQTDA